MKYKIKYYLELLVHILHKGKVPDKYKEVYKLELKYDNIHQYTVKCSNTSQITLDDDYNVPDSKPDIDSIVKDFGMVVLDSIRVNQDKAQVEGSLKYAILYIGKGQEEGSFLPVKMDGSLHFLENINLSCDASDTEVTCRARIEDLTIKSINSRKISVKAIVSLTVVCEEINNVAISSQITADEECSLQLLYKDYEYAQMDVNMRDNLRIKESLSLPNGKADVAELVWDDVDVKNMSTRMTEDGLSVGGELSVFIMYISNDDGQSVQWYETSVPFTGVIDVSGADPESICYVGFTLTGKNVEVRPDYDGNNREIAVELVLDMDIKSYRDCKNTALKDVYVPGSTMNIKQSEVKLKKLLIRNNTKCRVADNIKVADYINLMQIVNATAGVQIDDYEYTSEGIEVSGAVMVNVCYITSDDNAPMGSVNAVIPFTGVVAIKEYDKDNIEYMIRPCIEQLQASMNSSAQIEVKAVVSLDAICFEPVVLSTIEECEYTPGDGEYYASLPSMVGYISDGRCNMWDIAKKYNTTCDAIRRDNAPVQRLSDSDDVPRGTKLLLIKECMVAE